MPVPAQAAQPQQAPFGQTPATQATPNRGYQAAGMQRLGLVVKQLQDLIPLLGVNTDEGKAVLDSLSKLAKFVPPGAVTPAGEKNQLESMQLRNAQNNQQMQALRQQQMGAGGQPRPGGAPAGAAAA